MPWRGYHFNLPIHQEPDSGISTLNVCYDYLISVKQVEIDRYGHHKYNCCVVITLSVMLMKERWITLFTGSCKTMTPCMLNKESLAKGSIGWPRAIYVHGGHGGWYEMRMHGVMRGRVGLECLEMLPSLPEWN